ncbi:MAG: VacJ family lipoprotein [Betaproteobacteria bacterium]
MNAVARAVARTIAAAATATLMAGCALGPTKGDPLEPWNRAMYAIHEPIDTNVVRPVAQAYVDYVPRLFRLAVSNVFNNIDDLFSAVNGLLQGKPEKAGNDLGRVLINTGFGFGGLIDIASDAGIERGLEDFGQTFGVWGFPQGPYLFVPMFGPTTVRDGTGTLVRVYLGPVGFIPDVVVRNSLYGLGAVDVRAQALDTSVIIDKAALDRYTFIRRAYLQRREYLVNDGKKPPEKEDDE